MSRSGLVSPPIAIALFIISLATGCSEIRSWQPSSSSNRQTETLVKTSSLFGSGKSVQCGSSEEGLSEKLDQGLNLAIMTQTAKSQEDWNRIAIGWLQLIEKLQSIPTVSPQRIFAQKKVMEYMNYLTIAQQKANVTRTQFFLPSFDSELLDEQVVLYLSYLAAMGPPDVLIVGSSRGLQGVNPQYLHQTLTVQGNGDLKIFNFGINGATAQVVDFLIRQLLTPAQLPKLIVWADGSRAFNNGRVDRTFSAIANSPGYQRLLAGVRPVLPNENLHQDACTTLYRQSIQPTNITNIPKLKQKLLNSKWLFGEFLVSQITANPSLVLHAFSDAANAIDGNGFMSVNNRFNPDTYFHYYAKVPGRYDRDYAAFSLGGKQETALTSLVTFTREHHIPLVFVNLPLTKEYLDPVRDRYEQQFREYMQHQSQVKGFLFRDLNFPDLARNEFFADPSHLNRDGAAAVANYLGPIARFLGPKLSDLLI